MKNESPHNDVKPVAASPRAARSELFILPDGTIYAHNLTPVLAAVLDEILPGDAAMKARLKLLGAARRGQGSNNDA